MPAVVNFRIQMLAPNDKASRHDGAAAARWRVSANASAPLLAAACAFKTRTEAAAGWGRGIRWCFLRHSLHPLCVSRLRLQAIVLGASAGASGLKTSGLCSAQMSENGRLVRGMETTSMTKSAIQMKR